MSWRVMISIDGEYNLSYVVPGENKAKSDARAILKEGYFHNLDKGGMKIFPLHRIKSVEVEEIPDAAR
jgi:hypothetical protein